MGYWAKKFSEVHLPEPHFCGVPRLGNNYADQAVEENRDVCEKCLEMKIKFAQLCVWPGTIVGNSPEKIEEFTKDMAVMFKGARFLYVTEVFTKPDVVDGIHVRGTGGRNDLFFYIHDDDMSKFAVQRLQYGIRWWEDIIGNGELYLYPDDFIKRFPKRW
jgi:hypothetical protein